MQYASRLARFFAWVIDIIVIAILMVILGAVRVINFDRPDDDINFIIQAVVLLAYFTVLTIAFGATLGKMALGMRVVGADGGKASVGAVLIREIIVRWGATIVAFVLAIVLGEAMGGAGQGIAALVGILVGLVIVLRILVDDHRQGWHDKIGGTFVVKAR